MKCPVLPGPCGEPVARTIRVMESAHPVCQQHLEFYTDYYQRHFPAGSVELGQLALRMEVVG